MRINITTALMNKVGLKIMPEKKNRKKKKSFL